MTKEELLSKSPPELHNFHNVDVSGQPYRTREQANVLCKHCDGCIRCTECFACDNCTNCIGCSFCYRSIECTSCIGIQGGYGLIYVAFGVQLTSEEYAAFMAKYSP